MSWFGPISELDGVPEAERKEFWRRCKKLALANVFSNKFAGVCMTYFVLEFVSRFFVNSKVRDMLFVPFGIGLWVSFFVLVRRRTVRAAWRLLPDTCCECGYDIRATPECCPECGAAAEGMEYKKRGLDYLMVANYKKRFGKLTRLYLRDKLASHDLLPEAEAALRELLMERGEPAAARMGVKM